MSTFVGRRVAASTVPVRRQPLRLPLLLLITWVIVKTLAKVSYVLVRSPAALAGVVLLVLGVVAHRLGGSQFGFVVVVTMYVWLLFALLLVWLNVNPVRAYVRSRMRRFWVYRYRWPATMDLAGLNRSRKNGRQYAPVLGKVRSTVAGDRHRQKLAGVMRSSVDRVQARMLAGQTVDDWGKVSDRLCQTFGAMDCRVRSVRGRPHEVELAFLIEDPLAREVQPCYATDDLAALPVALQEDGEWYQLNLVGTHVLLVGATRAGKSSALWSILNQLRSNVHDGTVQIWALDPKGGMELALGASMFHRFVYGTTDIGVAFELDFAETLEDAVLIMRERQSALRGVVRVHLPSPAEPLILIVIDELAALTSYGTDRDVKRRIANALALLQSQGAAVGVTVLAAVQDPRKETVPDRDLFPTRILLRCTDADHVALVMGPGARDRGARADQIPESLPGVAFVQVDGVAEPVRVRFAYISDDYIGAWFAPARGEIPHLVAVPELDQAA
jgi:S-DNA-T family DNA segregation ATPase FtsK/SpoIIIE